MQATQLKSSTVQVLFFIFFWGMFFFAYDQSWRFELIPNRWYAPERLPYEYRFVEQMSKYMALMLLAVSIWAYRQSKNVKKVRFSIICIGLGLAVVMSEGDFIVSDVRLILGPVFLAGVLIVGWLYRLPGVSIYFLGCAVLGLGILGDIIQDRHLHQNPDLPPILAAIGEFLTWNEDKLEMLGMVTLCYAVFFTFLEDLWLIIAKNWLGAISIAVCLLAIVVGNSFLNYSYETSLAFKNYAFLVSLSGAAGVFLSNRFLIQKDSRLTLFSEPVFYACLFLGFVALPSIYSKTHSLINATLWLPIFVFCVTCLYKSHPLLTQPPAKPTTP